MNSDSANITNSATPAIEVSGVGKMFRLRRTGTRTLKSAILDSLRLRREQRSEFWALKEVSFTANRGETLGIIGSNGAGKSTLLSLLAGTKQPTEGTIRTHGTISSLLELAAGFHPDLTGRENVFLCGATLGLSRSRMKDRLADIIAFSEIESFIDQPVKHYSSGMYVRLGFAVAVEVDPDILLIDEVLAVGDEAFQRKCMRKIEEFRSKGKTLLIISHDLATIQSVSDRILMLDGGRVMGWGDPADVVKSYRRLSKSKAAKASQREWGTGEVKITGVDFMGADGRPRDKFTWNEPVDALIRYESAKRIENPVFGFAMSDSSARLIHGSNTQIEKFSVPSVEGKGAVRLRIEKLGVATGAYLFSFSVHSADHRVNYHMLDHAFAIDVENDLTFEGCCHMPVRWDKEKG